MENIMRSAKFLTVAVMGLVLCLAPASLAGEGEVYRYAPAGFSITKPAGWVYRFTRQGDPIPTPWKFSPRLLVTLAPQPETDDAVGAAVRVMFGPLEYYADMSPQAVLRDHPGAKGARVVKEAYPVKVSGRDAAMMGETYVARGKGKQPVEMMDRTWVVFGKDYVFFICMTDRVENPEVPEAVFREILESIIIEPRRPPG